MSRSGEAANSVADEAAAIYPEVSWHDIARLRVVLAHHYHRVDPEQVWVIAAADFLKWSSDSVVGRGPEHEPDLSNHDHEVLS